MVSHLCGLSGISWLVGNNCFFFKMHLKEFWRLKYLIFPCHSSCTVVSSDFPPFEGIVQLSAVRAAAESIPDGGESSYRG